MNTVLRCKPQTRAQMVLLWSSEVCWRPCSTVNLHGIEFSALKAPQKIRSKTLTKQHLFSDVLLWLSVLIIENSSSFTVNLFPVSSVDYRDVTFDTLSATKQMQSCQTELQPTSQTSAHLTKALTSDVFWGKNVFWSKLFFVTSSY